MNLHQKGMRPFWRVLFFLLSSSSPPSSFGLDLRTFTIKHRLPRDNHNSCAIIQRENTCINQSPRPFRFYLYPYVAPNGASTTTPTFLLESRAHQLTTGAILHFAFFPTFFLRSIPKTAWKKIKDLPSDPNMFNVAFSTLNCLTKLRWIISYILPSPPLKKEKSIPKFVKL